MPTIEGAPVNGGLGGGGGRGCCLQLVMLSEASQHLTVEVLNSLQSGVHMGATSQNVPICATFGPRVWHRRRIFSC